MHRCDGTESRSIINRGLPTPQATAPENGPYSIKRQDKTMSRLHISKENLINVTYDISIKWYPIQYLKSTLENKIQ